MKYVAALILTLLFSSLLSVTYIVRQDEQGNFTTIQSAIVGSAHGDTILVHPGIYYENINYSGKNLTIASLELPTGNPDYRNRTVIDGTNTNACIRIRSNEMVCTIYGFTVRNGAGDIMNNLGASGGGIYIDTQGQVYIKNCNIKDNKSQHGGGIYSKNCSLYLSNSIISNNKAHVGGGICFALFTSVYFDVESRCSVFENYGVIGNDIAGFNSRTFMDVYLDYFTVMPPSEFYLSYSDMGTGQPGGFNIIDIQRSLRTEINQNLYVSHEGNNQNDGLSPETSLKSITQAIHLIAADSLAPKAIYVAPGTYSSEQEVFFPISLKSYVKVIGDTLEIPRIVNSDSPYSVSAYRADGSGIENFRLVHGNFQPEGTLSVSQTENFTIRNFIVDPVTANETAGLLIYKSCVAIDGLQLRGLSSPQRSGIDLYKSSAVIKNSEIDDCYVTDSESTSGIFIAESCIRLEVENLSITNCTSASRGRALFHVLSFTQYNGIPPAVIKMSNILMMSNYLSNSNNGCIDLEANHDSLSMVTNCTFANNNMQSTLHFMAIKGRLAVRNCIFDNDAYREIVVSDPPQNSYAVNITYNLIRGYPATVVTINEDTPFESSITNNLNLNPGFIGIDWTDPLSYRLNFDSPCIDAGAHDATELYLPEYDLSGNPRIYNRIIDIGCYEWSATASPEESIVPLNDELILSNHPNPFNFSTNIAYTLPREMQANLTIYNLKGQKIKTLTNGKQTKGEHSIVWDGTDEDNHIVSTGIYFYQLQTPQGSLTSKLVRLK